MTDNSQTKKWNEKIADNLLISRATYPVKIPIL